MVDLSSVNLVAVLVAAIVNYVFGMIWYSPNLFGTTWGKEMGIDMKNMSKEKMKKSMITGFIGMLVGAFFIGAIHVMANPGDMKEAFHLAILLSLAFWLPAGIGAVAWAQHSWKLTWINIGWNTISTVIVMLVMQAM